MDELELRRKLSGKTTDILVEIIMELLALITEMEMMFNEENQKEASNGIDGLLNNLYKR